MRTKNSIRNVIVALSGQIIVILLSFVSRRLFVISMSETLLGVNSVFANLLSILSLAELGIGTAITFSLYQPLAEDDIESIQAIMNFYKQVYRVIAVVVAGLGTCFIPFFPYIIKETIPNLYLYYILYLSSTVISYLCSYKRTIIIADQKSYISSFCRNAYLVMLNITQIIILLLFRSYVGFLVVQIVLSFLENIVISKIADKMYPYLNNISIALSKEKKNRIYKDIRALMMHRIGSVIVTNTDSILLSALVNIKAAAIYANYKLVISGINTLLVQIYSSLMASVGNLLVGKNKEHSYKIYETIQMITYWIYGTCSICMFVLLNDLIGIWVGKRFEETACYVFVLVANFFILGVREPTNIFKNSCGLFQNDKYKALIESIVNIILSLALGIKYGAIGIFGATLISCLVVPYWIEPYVLYKNYWKKPLIDYFVYSLKQISIVLFVGIIINYFGSFVKVHSWRRLVGKSVVIFIFTNILFLLFYIRTSEFKILLNKGKDMLKSKKGF